MIVFPDTNRFPGVQGGGFFIVPSPLPGAGTNQTLLPIGPLTGLSISLNNLKLIRVDFDGWIEQGYDYFFIVLEHLLPAEGGFTTSHWSVLTMVTVNRIGPMQPVTSTGTRMWSRFTASVIVNQPFNYIYSFPAPWAPTPVRALTPNMSLLFPQSDGRNIWYGNNNGTLTYSEGTEIPDIEHKHTSRRKFAIFNTIPGFHYPAVYRSVSTEKRLEDIEPAETLEFDMRAGGTTIPAIGYTPQNPARMSLPIRALSFRLSNRPQTFNQTGSFALLMDGPGRWYDWDMQFMNFVNTANWVEQTTLQQANQINDLGNDVSVRLSRSALPLTGFDIGDRGILTIYR